MGRRRDLATRASTVEPDPPQAPEPAIARSFFFFSLLNVNDWHDDAAHFPLPSLREGKDGHDGLLHMTFFRCERRYVDGGARVFFPRMSGHSFVEFWRAYASATPHFDLQSSPERKKKKGGEERRKGGGVAGGVGVCGQIASRSSCFRIPKSIKPFMSRHASELR